jgi:hypothetical protein
MPALQAGNGRAFDNAHVITLFETILRIMGMVFLRKTDRLMVNGVFDLALNAHDNGLVVHIAHHYTL